MVDTNTSWLARCLSLSILAAPSCLRSAAPAGVKHRLDLFGVLVLSFAAGNSGGIARDVMIGSLRLPPSATGDTSLSPSLRG